MVLTALQPLAGLFEAPAVRTSSRALRGITNVALLVILGEQYTPRFHFLDMCQARTCVRSFFMILVDTSQT